MDESSDRTMSFCSNSSFITYTCPYCKRPQGCQAFCFWAFSLTVQDFDLLAEQGWCRSGRMIYKPLNDLCCCPQYSMRLKVSEFVLSKSHARIIKKMQRFVSGDWKPTFDWRSVDYYVQQTQAEAQTNDAALLTSSPVDMNGEKAVKSSSKRSSSSDNFKSSTATKGSTPLYHSLVLSVLLSSLKELDWLSRLPPLRGCPSWLLRASASASGLFSNVLNVLQRALHLPLEVLAVRLLPLLRSGLPHLHIEHVDGRGLLCFHDRSTPLAPRHTTRKGCRRRNIQQPEDRQKAFKRLLTQLVADDTKSMLEITLERPKFSEEFFDLYVRYQVAVHHDAPDKLTRRQFVDFLVETPLLLDKKDAPATGYGSFHRCYRLRGKLVAVGVIDILPTCVNSSYFVWDPALKALSLGAFSCLEEIEMLRNMSLTHPRMQYYYLGYYVCSSEKMQYKTQYQPAELCDPNTQRWMPFQQVIADHHNSSSREQRETDRLCKESYSFTPAAAVPESMHVLFRGKALSWAILQNTEVLPEGLEQILANFIAMVGPKLAASIVYVLR